MSDDMLDIFQQHQVDPKGHQVSTEDTVVRKLLAVGGGINAATLSRDCFSDTGSRSMTLAWFCSRNPRFPYWLGYRKVKYQRDALGDFTKRFSRTPCYRAWEEIEQDKQDDRPAGCVFGWPKFGYCIIRRIRTFPTPIDNGLWIVKRTKQGIFLIETVKQYCLSVKNWNCE